MVANAAKRNFLIIHPGATNAFTVIAAEQNKEREFILSASNTDIGFLVFAETAPEINDFAHMHTQNKRCPTVAQISAFSFSTPQFPA